LGSLYVVVVVVVVGGGGGGGDQGLEPRLWALRLIVHPVF
jgi:hypothetical protein